MLHWLLLNSGSRLGRTILILCVSGLAFAYSGCTRSPAAKRDKFIAAGKKQFEKRDYGRALLEFKNAAQVMPGDAESYYQIGITSLAMGNFRGAIVMLRKTIDLDPKHMGARVRLAALMSTSHETQDVEKGKSELEQVLVISPNDLDALDALAAAELKLGDVSSAEGHLKRAIELSPHRIQAGVELAKLRMSRRDWSGAEAVLKQVVIQNPEMSAAQVALAEYYVSRNMLPAAEEAYAHALSTDRKDAAAITGLAGLKIRARKPDEAEKLLKDLSVLASSENVLYGEFLLRSGKRELAIREFQRLVKANPDDRAIRSRLLGAYLTSGKESDAAQLLETALKKNPNDTEALLARAGMDLSLRKDEQAETDARTVLRFTPNSAEAHKILAGVSRMRGKGLNERQELTDVVRLDPPDFAARIRLVQILRASKAYKAALDTMVQAPPEQRKTLAWIIERNRILEDSGAQAELARGIEDGLKLRRVPDLILQLGELNYQQRNYAAARAASEELLKTHPTDTLALDLMARTYVAETRSAVALKRIEDAAAKQPSSARLQLFLGRFLLFMKKPEEGRRAFLAAERLDPKSAAPVIALSEMDLKEGRYDQVRKALAPLIASGSTDVDARMILAEAELGAGNYVRALELYRKVADEQPGNAKAQNNTAYVLVNRAHKPEEALPYAQLAVELAPGSPAEEHTLGWVLYSKGLYQMAVTHLQTAAAKDPNAEHLYHFAAGCFKAGDEARGQHAFAEALKIDPKSPEADVARTALAQSKK